MSPCIMGLTTQDPYNQEGHTELYKIFKFRVNWANFEQDTAVQKPQNLLRNVWISGQVFGNPYINKASPKQSHQSRFFLCFFYYLFNDRNLIYKLSTAFKRTEQNKAIIIPAGVFPNCSVSFPYKLTYNCSKTTRRVTFMQKFKQITNRDTGNGIQ